MFWQLLNAYPWGLITTVILPLVGGVGAVIAGVFYGAAGYETLKRQFVEDRRAERIEQSVTAIHEDKTDLQTTLALLSSFNDKLTAAGKRDEVLAALLNQYQLLVHAADMFGQQIGKQDTSQEQGKLATKILEILSEEIVRTIPRFDQPGNALIFETGPNCFRVVFAVPMARPPDITFTGVPQGATASVSDRSEISFTVTFYPPSIPVHTFGIIASAEL
jgi:hypothetical protein